MRSFRFYLAWTWCLIKTNPAKTIAAIALIAAAPFLNGIPDIVEYKRVDYRYEKDGREFYVIQSIEKNEEKFEARAYDKGNPPEIKNGRIVERRWNDANIVLFLVAGAAAIMIAVGIFAKDEDISFDLRKVFSMSASRFVECELEDGSYFYFLDGRLLGKSDRELHREYDYLCRHFSVSSRSKLASFPKWKTKNARRGEKLDNLGI